MAEQELEQLEGTVEDIIYENADNGLQIQEASSHTQDMSTSEESCASLSVDG